MAVHHVTGMADYYNVCQKKGLTVIDFSATWCGPCKMISPHFDALATKYGDAMFAKVVSYVNIKAFYYLDYILFKVTEDDGVEGKAIVAEAGVRGFPSFFFFIDGVKKDEMSGANPAGLEAMVLKYYSMVPRSFEGSGYSLGGGSEQSLEAAREARLRRFGGGPSTQSTAPISSISSSLLASMASAMEDEDEDPELQVS